MHRRPISDLSGFDPRSATFRANPYPVYRSLQSTAPVYRRQAQRDWLITRYRDVEAVLKSQDFGRSDQTNGLQPVTSEAATPLQKMRDQSFAMLGRWAVLQNPPSHTALRNRMRRLFTADRLRHYEEIAKNECAARLSALTRSGQFDLIGDVADPVAMRVNAEILGIAPDEHSPKFRAWTDGLSRLTDLQPSQVDGEQGLMALAALAGYFRRLLSLKQRTRSEGLFGVLAEELRDGDILEIDALSMLSFMFAVGHSSTVNLIGNSVYTLLSHPDQLAKLNKNAGLLDSAIIEVLRFESPVQSISRTAMIDTQVADIPIARGDTIHLVIGAANRDPDVFIAPDDFEIIRQQLPNLSFGTGVHTCIGLRLAQATTSVVLRMLLKVPIKSTESPEWDEPYLGRGLKALNISRLA